MAFNKLVEAMGLYDHWLDAQSAVPNEDHQWAQHAVQSMIWREAGASASQNDIKIRVQKV